MKKYFAAVGITDRPNYTAISYQQDQIICRQFHETKIKFDYKSIYI
jgi:hypothetical protein